MNKFIVSTIFFCGFSLAQSGFAQSVGIKYDINATNPAAVIAAMDKFAASATGQSGPGTVTLFQYVVNGESSATHNFVVNYPNLEAMDATFARNAMSQDWATFLTELTAVSEQVGTLMFRSTGITNGDPFIGNVTDFCGKLDFYECSGSSYLYRCMARSWKF